jgi:hypothetical protein
MDRGHADVRGISRKSQKVICKNKTKYDHTKNKDSRSSDLLQKPQRQQNPAQNGTRTARNLSGVRWMR